MTPNPNPTSAMDVKRFFILVVFLRLPLLNVFNCKKTLMQINSKEYFNAILHHVLLYVRFLGVLAFG